MAIKFGDILQNQNAAFPIVDGSNNDIKGVIFSTGLPADADFPNKRAIGTILVDTSADKMYFYTGNDLLDATWGDTANWSEMAQGSGETVQTTDIPISIPTGTSFGRFTSTDGSIDVGTGSTAMQIIIKALTAFQAPTAAYAGSEGSIQYDTVTQTKNHTVTFSVTNQNQSVVSGTNFAIQSVKLYRRQGTNAYGAAIATATSSGSTFTSGTFANLNSAGSPTAVTFTFNDSFSHSSSSTDYNYKIEVIPLDSAGSAGSTVDKVGNSGENKSGYINSLSYSEPDIDNGAVARQDTSSHFNTTGTGSGTTETSTRREKGNIATKITFTLDNNSSLVPITAYSLRRSINGGTPVEIKAETGLSIVGTTNGARSIFDSITTGANNVTGLNGTPTGFTDVSSAFPGANVDADTVQYSITITDDEGTTSASNVGEEINFEFPGMIGYGTTDASLFTSSNNSTMTTLLQAIRDTGGLRAQYEILSTADNLSGQDPNFGVVPLSPSGTQFVYIGYPAGLDEITNVTDPSNIASYGSFGNDPKSVNVPFTTHYGVQGTYEFYGSNGVGAYTGNYTIN